MKISLEQGPTAKDWILVRKITLATVGKDTNSEPSFDWKVRLLRARHSPIRELHFVFHLKDIPYWVAMHLVRHHIGCQPYIQTQRTDRTGVDRTEKPQDAPVDMWWSMNAEALITIANKRLCRMAAKETRQVVEEMCRQVRVAYPEFDSELVPICERTHQCYEMKGCGKVSSEYPRKEPDSHPSLQ